MRLEDVKAHLDILKQELRKTVQGKTMVRQDRSYKGLEQEGVMSYLIYFDIPTPTNAEAIKRAIHVSGFYGAHTYRVIGGAYGYSWLFRTEQA